MVKSFWDRYATQRAAQRSIVELRRPRGALRPRPPLRRRSGTVKR